MPFCPKCQTEYREGFSTCADCHVPLVAELPPLPEPEPLPDSQDFGEPTLLLTADTELEADMLVALFTDSGIPAYKQYDGASGVLKGIYGTALLGARVYVPANLIEQAQELHTAYLPAGLVSGDDEYVDEYVGEYTEEQ